MCINFRPFQYHKLNCVRKEHKPARSRCFATVTLRLTHNLETRRWPRYSKDTFTLKMKLLAKGNQNLELEFRKCLKVKRSKAPNCFERYRNRYSDQASAISDQYFLSCTLPLFRCCDLDLGPMTLKLNSDLDILKMHLHSEMNLLGKAVR